MNILLIKLGAAGDVVRTTPLLRTLDGNEVTWITRSCHVTLLRGLIQGLRVLPWEQRSSDPCSRYDLVINLEDDPDVAKFAGQIRSEELVGAFMDKSGIRYTQDSSPWFDLSMISIHGRKAADKLKLENRQSYQELLFSCFGMRFSGERYLLPLPISTDLKGDVGIAPVAGSVWPMKNWAYYPQLILALESSGYKVNILPARASLREHLGDICNHRIIVSGDSLPMHLALGAGIPCVTLFTCTSPWEIYDYGIQRKIVSPMLERYFYRRDFDAKATTAIGIGEVIKAVATLFLGKVNVAHP